MNIQVKKIKPLFTNIVTTMDRYEDDQMTGGLLDGTKTKGSLKEIQQVVAVGDLVKNIKVGDYVCINPRDYEVRRYDANSIKNDLGKNDQILGYHFNFVSFDGNVFLLLKDRDIDYVVAEFLEIKESSIATAPELIV